MGGKWGGVETDRHTEREGDGERRKWTDKVREFKKRGKGGGVERLARMLGEMGETSGRRGVGGGGEGGRGVRQRVRATHHIFTIYTSD